MCVIWDVHALSKDGEISEKNVQQKKDKDKEGFSVSKH